MKKFIIIDGNAIIHRAYHALPPMTTKDGQMVNAVYGFTSMLLRVWKDLQPDYIAVAFDLAGPTFRHIKYKEYKATRVKADQELYDQIPLVHQLVEAFNIPIFEKSGFEADDVIGTIVNIVQPVNQKQDQENVPEIYVVTGDMDTLQLIRKNVKIYTLRKGMSDIVVYDALEVKNKYGFGPEYLVDYKALRGDVSDNIPGVSGIGEKTATELINKYGGITSIYNHIKKESLTDCKPAVLKKLIAGKKDAEMSFELATIDVNVPDLEFDLNKCEAKDFNRDKVIDILRQWEFFSLIKRLPGENVSSEIIENIQKKNSIVNRKIQFRLIDNQNQLEEIMGLIKKNSEYAIKIILSDKDVLTAEIKAVAVVTGMVGAVIPLTFFKNFSRIFSDANIRVVVHDVKNLYKVLKLNQLVFKNQIFDLMLASYLLNPGVRSHDELSLAIKYSGQDIKSFSGQNSLFGVDHKQLLSELNILYLSAEKLEKELGKVNNLDLLNKIEIPTALILADMELNGVKIDLPALSDLSKNINKEIKTITGEIHALAGEDFNIGSPVQLREVLFNKIEIPVLGIKKGKTGLSTAQAELEKMRGLHPIIDKIIKWRELTKLQNTYVDVLPNLVSKKTGRLHTSFNQAVTATGRLSSSEPNLQNIPIRGELGRLVRKTFIAEPDNVLISVDYSQIELRIVASLAEDKKMIDIFNKGEDIHLATAAVINNVALDKVTKEMRRSAKEVNFGVLYGMGSYGLSWRTELSPAEAKKFIDKYFHEFNGVKKYLDTTITSTREIGYSETLFGRRRYLPEINASNFQIRTAAERMAINHPIQGTAADLMKMAMIEIDKRLKENNISDKVRLLLQVHDEILIETQEVLAKKVSLIIKDAMENVVVLLVPVIVDVNIAKSWGDMK